MTTPPLVVEATRNFLRRHAPFDRVGDDVLAAMIPKLKLAYFARDSTILAPEQGPVMHLHIVQRGLVGRRAVDPRGEADSALGPGDLFPVGALSGGAASTRVYHAVQDTFCYLLARDAFLELRRISPEFERFWTQAVAEKLKQSLSQLQGQYSQLAAEQQTLNRPLAELIRRPPISIAATAPLVDALTAMREATVRTVVVINDTGSPVGIFTLVDLLDRVVLAGKALSTPVSDVMTSPAVTLPASASAHEALQLMADGGIRQVVVVDGAHVAGLVSERDLFALQRVSMRQVSQTLRDARDRGGLERAAADIRHLTRNLLAQGAAAEPLTRTIAALNDALSRRIIELALSGHDLGNCDWCWLALGSEGRGEQTFATDQDNALVFSAAGGDVAVARSRLVAFAQDVNATLDAVGFPLCAGNVMAGNPELCLTVDEWKARFLNWIREPTPDALLQANIVFDFRPLFGDTTLGDTLREWLHGYTRDGRIFPPADGAERARDRRAARPDPRVRHRRRCGASRHDRSQDARHAPLRRCGTRVRAGRRHHGNRHGRPSARGGQMAQRRGPPCRRHDRRISLPAAAATAPAGFFDRRCSGQSN